ncbi:MAG TPA: PhzF family phenazine biosynthesis protein [Dermatophilaceae bacterium]|jgi:PhzF family phenazine biosynthesis protein|nr:PhzF family phenazine biosynthesis protein [Dermatophilaceae bacterium]HMT89857.1 PhzF family phenazine biosynthesis protein [Dermatophilaceae bacterium]
MPSASGPTEVTAPAGRAGWAGTPGTREAHELHVEFVNVFSLAGQPFSGNPLAVVTDAAALETSTMLALARQFNLSETTFVTDIEGAQAAVRIFTPTVELPFAGHPTLGTAAVLGEAASRGQSHAGDHIVLRLPAGDIPVTRDHAGYWRLVAVPGPIVAHVAGRDDLASMLQLPQDAIVGGWRVAAGVEQVLVQVTSPAAVRQAGAAVEDLVRWGRCSSGESLVYVWAFGDGVVDHAGVGSSDVREVTARLFFTQDTVVAEDPATGSAAANLGTLLAERGSSGRLEIRQGDQVARPSLLRVDYAPGTVGVAGLVHRVGHAVVTVPRD